MCEIDDEMADMILQEKKPPPSDVARVDARTFSCESRQVMIVPDGRLSKSAEPYVLKAMEFKSPELGVLDIVHVCEQKYAVLTRHTLQHKLKLPVQEF